MHKFNESSLTVDLINNLLYNYWLPTYDTVQAGDYIHKNNLYILYNKVIKCTKSGYIGGKYIQLNMVGKELPVDSRYKVAAYLPIWNYEIGGRYRKFTDNYISTSSRYTTELHERLGKFVLAYSDTTGIDLRPFYNCNSNRYIDNLCLYRETNVETGLTTFTFMEARTKLRILLVPIRFNRTYTIALDCPGLVVMCPAFISHNKRLVFLERNETKTLATIDLTLEFLDTTGLLFIFPSMNFSKPKYIEVKCLDAIADKYLDYLKNLYLLILMPENTTTSVVVLEGKYKSNYTEFESYGQLPEPGNPKPSTFMFEGKILAEKIFNNAKILSVSDLTLNKKMISNLSLLQFNIDENIPFANRLVEYLFDNVIDQTWKLDTNIEKAQKLLTNAYTGELPEGIWSKATRVRMFEEALKYKKSRHLDITGNIDREVERILLASPYNSNGEF